jgi:hypothetical protein
VFFRAIRGRIFQNYSSFPWSGQDNFLIIQFQCPKRNFFLFPLCYDLCFILPGRVPPCSPTEGAQGEVAYHLPGRDESRPYGHGTPHSTGSWYRVKSREIPSRTYLEPCAMRPSFIRHPGPGSLAQTEIIKERSFWILQIYNVKILIFILKSHQGGLVRDKLRRGIQPLSLLYALCSLLYAILFRIHYP